MLFTPTSSPMAAREDVRVAFRTLPLTKAEFQVIASNIAPYLR